MCYVLASLALSLALSPSHSLTRRETPILNILPSTSSPISSPNSPPSLDDRLTSSLNGFPLTNENINFSQDEVDCNEVQVNLIVNQLAILRLLNGTKSTPDPASGVNEREIQQLKQSLASLNNTVSAQGPASEVNERELQQLKQSLASLNDTVSAQVPASEVNERELQQLKQSLASLNDTVSAQGREIEEQKREIEEQKSEIEDKKRVNEEQKREFEEHKREIEEIFATIYEDCSVEGDLHINDDCSISLCQQGFLHPYQGSSAPNVSFSDLLAKNCIHLERGLKSWDAARANCVALGGDLFVAGDFRGAIKYLVEQIKSLSTWPWVGGKRREWIDGRPVAPGEWEPSRPDDALDSCVFAHSKGLDDRACSNTWTSLCVKGTTY